MTCPTMPKGAYTLDDFNSMEKPEVRWLVDDLLIAGGTSVLVAKPKVGKSVLARQLAVAVAQGKDFLGRKTMQGGVIYAGLEDNAQKSAEHFGKLGAINGDPIILFDLWQQTGADTLRATLEARPDTKLVIVDTLFRMFPVQSADDYMQTTRSLNGLLALSQQHHVHICALHHMGKKARDDAQDGVLGSTAIAGSVETILMMHRQGTERSIETRQRHGNDMEKTKLLFDAQIGSSTLALPIETNGVIGSPVESAFERIRRAICEFLRTYPGSTQAIVLSGVPGDTDLKLQTLRQMTGGVLRRDGSGRKGNPYLYWLVEIQVERDIPIVTDRLQ